MDKYPPQFSKVLLTPEPHYIPGYTGYCPQLKYSFAKPYGKVTSDLLTSPEVNHSNHLVLTTGRYPYTGTDPMLRGHPDCYLSQPSTGYTGFIPNSRNYFACSYADTCRQAMTESYHENQARLQRQVANLPAVVSYDLQHAARPRPPLTPISHEAFIYRPLQPFIPPGNPYLLDDEHPDKYFMSGFTGHVPRTRFLSGKGYPITTNKALIQFRKMQLADSPPSQTIITPYRPTWYQSFIPAFTGHIQGYRPMYGRSFGVLSNEALAKIHTTRILRGEY